MKRCRITVMRKASYPDLSERYENPMEQPCDMEEGQVFFSDGGKKPEGLYEGWMKNPRSVMISCNDGFRPVSFLIEVMEE